MDASRGTSASTIFPMPRQIPPLLFPPPPPPAAALPSSSLSLSSYSSRGHAPSITSFPILVLTVLGILAASVLLLTYYVFVIRCCLTWHRDRSSSGASSDVAGLIIPRRGRRPQRTTTSSSAAPATDAEPRGLDAAAIRGLPAFSYRKTKPANAAAESPPSAPASECAVCLGELEEGDRVRMLPACRHVFHLACVDAWLQGNATCPLCRASADVAATLCRLPPPPPPSGEEVAVDIQVVVVPGGAEEDNQGTLTRAQQREATVAPSEFESDTCTHLQVGGEKTKSAIDGCHGDMTERRKDGDGEALPPTTRTRTRRSFSTDDGDAMAGGRGGEVHLQIQNILHRDGHSRTHDHDNHSRGVRV